ncbi:MAG: acyl-CoA thioesterase [Aurantibacter sp.]
MKNYPISINCQVRWGEMDALGHINNTVYFRYFEDVRIEYFKKLGFEAVTSDQEMGPILAQISCQFLRPVEYPDQVTIGVWVARIGNTSLQMDYEIYSEQHQEVVATGTSVIVMINYQTGAKIQLPNQKRQQIQDLQIDFKTD